MTTKRVLSDTHLGTLGSGLWQLRCHELTTDAWLYCTESLIPVHRAVLAACSPYFDKVVAAVSKTGGQPVIVLPRAQPDQMLKLLEYMYLGRMDVEESELSGMDGLAKYFKMDDLCHALGAVHHYVAPPANPPPVSHRRREVEIVANAGTTSPVDEGPASKKKKLRGPRSARRRTVKEDEAEEQAEAADEPVEQPEPPKLPKKRRTDTEDSSTSTSTRPSRQGEVQRDEADGKEEIEVDGEKIILPKGILKPPKWPVERVGWVSYSGMIMEKGTEKQIFFCAFKGCNHKAKYRRGFSGHEKGHLRHVSYICPVCVYGFQDEDGLRTHVMHHHCEDPLQDERESYEQLREEMDDDEDAEDDVEVNGVNESSVSASDDEVAVSVSSSHENAFDRLLASPTS